jgi:hypothetical protein
MPTYFGDALTVQEIATPAAPTVTKRGGTGSTTYTYEVVAIRGDGHTAHSDPASVTNGASSMSTINSIAIRPAFVANALFFDIYRTAGGPSQGKIARIPASNVGIDQRSIFVDTGVAGDSTSAPTLNTTGMVHLSGVVVLDALPSSDPLVAGHLWVDGADGHTIKVSQGA